MNDACKRRLPHVLPAVLAGVLLSLVRPGLAADDLREAAQLLAESSLEDLLETRVTTVSRRAERVADSAASVTVITAEDIARSSSQHLADLLRTVPGMQVGRINNSRWAISTRGGNSLFASNLLVMVDGRTVYSPVFSGVWWDTQDLPLDEIARIEIIRGPGAALWGVNAVSGVINIITKDATNTKGGLVSAGIGSVDKASLYARYGVQYDDAGYARLYAQRSEMQATTRADGTDGRDNNRGLRVGLRLDQSFGGDRKLTVTGESYRLEGDGGEILVPLPQVMQGKNYPSGYPQDGFHLMARYSQPVATGQLALQAFYINEVLRDTAVGLSYWRHTWDFDFQHSLDFEQHRLVWGGGVRRNTLTANNSHYIGFHPGNLSNRLTNLFVQDEIGFLDNRLRLTLGSKFESSSEYKMQVQPNVRLLYTLDDGPAVWTALSRAARAPYWAQRYVEINQEWRRGCAPQKLLAWLPCNILVRGNPDSEPELTDTWEVGYRTRLRQTASLDVSAFVSRTRQAMSFEIDMAQVRLKWPALLTPYLELPMHFGNLDTRRTAGLESALDWQPHTGLRLRAGAAWYWERFAERDSLLPADAMHATLDQTFGRRSLFVRGSHDWTNFNFDWTLRHLDKPPRYGEEYTALDLRLAWQAARDLELALSGNHLGAGKREEFGVPWFVAPTRIEPEWTLRAKWFF